MLARGVFRRRDVSRWRIPDASAKAAASGTSAGRPGEAGGGASGSPDPLAGPKRRYTASPRKNTTMGETTATVRVTPVPTRRAPTSATLGTKTNERPTE